MGKSSKKSTTVSFLGATGWYAIVAMIIAAVLVTVWVVSAIAKIAHTGISEKFDTVQTLVVWEVVDGAFIFAPIVFAFLLVMTMIVGVLEVKTFKVVSAVTQENQTLIISPDGNPLHRVQISTGMHARLPEQNSGTPPSVVPESQAEPQAKPQMEQPQMKPQTESQMGLQNESESEEQPETYNQDPEEPATPTTEEPKSKKRPGMAWHHFWLKLRDSWDAASGPISFILLLISHDYDPNDDEVGDGWMDAEDDEEEEPILSSRKSLFATAAEFQNTQRMLNEMEITDLDALPDLRDVEQSRKTEEQEIEQKIKEAQTKFDKEIGAISGNTGEITQSITDALNRAEASNEVIRIIDECNNTIGKDVANIVEQDASDLSQEEIDRIMQLDDGYMTGKDFLKTQALMAEALEESGFDLILPTCEELQTRPERWEDDILESIPEETIQKEPASEETAMQSIAEEVKEAIVVKQPTTLAAQPRFDVKTAEAFEMLLKVMEFIQRHNISQAELMAYCAAIKAQSVQEETAKVDEDVLDRLCLQHQLELATVECALVVNYPDQNGITLLAAVGLEDSVLKHRAIAHNLGLFPEELNYVLEYLNLGITEINTPDDIKDIWNIASIAITAIGLRDGYDPSVCLKAKEANIVRFIDDYEMTNRPVDVIKASDGYAKVFPFPGHGNNKVAMGTGKLPINTLCAYGFGNGWRKS